MASPSYSFAQVNEKEVFHATNFAAGLGILATGGLQPGSRGLYGAGIYFAESSQFAMDKARYDGAARGAIVVFKVLADFGRALEIEGACSDMTGERVKERGCQSVKGRSWVGAQWEFVLYDPKRIKKIVKVEVINGDHYPGESQEIETAFRSFQNAMGPHDFVTEVRLVRGQRIPAGFQRLNVELDILGISCRDCQLSVCFQRSTNRDNAIYECCYCRSDDFGDYQSLGGHGNPYHPHRLEQDGGIDKGPWTTTGKVTLRHRGHTALYYSVETVNGDGPTIRCLYFTRDNPEGKRPIVDLTANRSTGAPTALPPGWEYVCTAGTGNPANFYQGNQSEFVYLAYRRA
jgi:hypothetical protein